MRWIWNSSDVDFGFVRGGTQQPENHEANNRRRLTGLPSLA